LKEKEKERERECRRDLKRGSEMDRKNKKLLTDGYTMESLQKGKAQYS